MGVDVSTDMAIEQEAYRLDVEPWKRWLPKLVMSPAGDGSFFEINLHPNDASLDMNWRLADASGNLIRSGRIVYSELEESGEYIFGGVRYSRRKVVLGQLPPNYYHLDVVSPKKTESTMLAVYPSSMHEEYWCNAGEKIWGVIVQLYTLRSERNWGIGDFTDLCRLLEELAKKGADLVGLNPLHALSPYLNDYFSPYSPSDRRYINALYIDPHRASEYKGQVERCVDASLLEELRASEHVDYVKVRDLKYPVFERMFDNFIADELIDKSPRFEDFKRYVEEEGTSLLKFAYFEACHQTWKNSRFVLRNQERFEHVVNDMFSTAPPDDTRKSIMFHCYLQWLADGQLAACQQMAKSLGMKVGLVRDLAVGADGGCAEVSNSPDLFCRQSSIGAPPDPFAHTGQNWGLPPVIPSEMRRTGFQHFRQLLKSNMKNCGALRIDHAMSLMRLWWCPPGKTADYGAYVYYPFYEMLGLLLLESYLNKCLIIAEDLGVVPNEFREALSESQVFTNKVFYFEKVFHDKFKPPQDYDSHSMAMVNNHDLPTLVSWWNGTDLVLRNELNLLEEGVDYADLCAERKRNKEHLLNLLSDSGLCPDDWSVNTADKRADRALVGSILLLTSKTASKIFVMQLEDLLLMDEPVNVPGTFKQHANWQRKLTNTIADIFSSTRINQWLEKINQQRKQ